MCFFKKPKPMPQPDPIPTPQPEVPKYDWSNPTTSRHSVRVICDEEGLTFDEKELICATIECESGFDKNRTNKNADGTVDYGICQMNTHWYIGKGKPIASIDEAINDCEKCVRVMIHAYQGKLPGYRLKNWVCFSGNYFKKYYKGSEDLLKKLGK